MPLFPFAETAGFFVDLPPAFSFDAAGAFVLAHGPIAQFPLELLVALKAARVEFTRVERGPDRAPGLGAVLAIVKPALDRKRFDIAEGLLHPGFIAPQLNLAHARVSMSSPPPPGAAVRGASWCGGRGCRLPARRGPFVAFLPATH